MSTVWLPISTDPIPMNMQMNRCQVYINCQLIAWGLKGSEFKGTYCMFFSFMFHIYLSFAFLFFFCRMYRCKPHAQHSCHSASGLLLHLKEGPPLVWSYIYSAGGMKEKGNKHLISLSVMYVSSSLLRRHCLLLWGNVLTAFSSCLL